MPSSKSNPNNTNFAAFLPKPAPPVINFKFENRCEAINTSARVTKPKFKPFNLTEIGAIMRPTKPATTPESGSQTIISNSYPITYVEPTPPNTAAV